MPVLVTSTEAVAPPPPGSREHRLLISRVPVNAAVETRPPSRNAPAMAARRQRGHAEAGRPGREPAAGGARRRRGRPRRGARRGPPAHGRQRAPRGAGGGVGGRRRERQEAGDLPPARPARLGTPRRSPGGPRSGLARRAPAAPGRSRRRRRGVPRGAQMTALSCSSRRRARSAWWVRVFDRAERDAQAVGDLRLGQVLLEVQAQHGEPWIAERLSSASPTAMPRSSWSTPSTASAEAGGLARPRPCAPGPGAGRRRAAGGRMRRRGR